MSKEKLNHIRKKRGFTQKQMADYLCMDVSNYQRRESGEKNITIEEWQQLAQILDVPVTDIYESDEKLVFIFQDNAQNNSGISYNYTVPEYLLDNQQKYINKLEEENERLRNLLQSDNE